MIDASKILILNKPKNWTSNDAVQKVKKILGVKKIGHAGTLDPMATGVLVLGIDSQTKKLSQLTLEDKKYLATIEFGKQTNTFDYTGKIITQKAFNHIDINQINAELDKFKKHYLQVVPKYSAVKIHGKKLYEYARKNEQINLPKKEVKLLDYKIVSYNSINGILVLELTVSKGFYVRSLANDLGISLNSYGYLTDLVRLRSGEYDIKNSFQIKEIQLEQKILELNLNKQTIAKDNKKLIIGYFDGIHQGHLKLFEKLKPYSFNVLTFKNIPNKKVDNLFDYYDRIEGILSLKPNKIFVYDLDKNNTDAKTFINKIIKKIDPLEVIIGSDFIFGSDRISPKIFMENNIKTKIILIDDSFKTTKIKELIKEGNFLEANRLLIKHHYFSGSIGHGKAFGRLMNFPTLNFFSKDNIIRIKEGSYVSLTKVDGTWHDSMTCVNIKEGKQIFETNIIDGFNENVYGMIAKVQLLKFIRKFEKINGGIDNLKKTINSDLEYTKKYLKLDYAKEASSKNNIR